MSRLIAISWLTVAWPLAALALDDPTISVRGSAEIRVRPDQVVLTASVQSRSPQLATVKEDNDKKIAGVIEFLKAAQVPVADIQADFIKIEPVYPRAAKGYSSFQSKQPPVADPLKPAGYIARRDVNIRIRDIKSFEQIYSGFIGRGISIEGIQFQSSQRGQLNTDARKQAIAAAKAKAELLVSELGAKLSGVQSIQDKTTEVSPVTRATSTMDGMMDEMFDQPVALPRSTGEIRITAAVEVVFRMSETDFD